MRALAGYKEKMSGFLSGKGSAGVPIGDAGYVVLDTELTGLDIKTNSIISIGAVKMRGAAIELGNVFYKLINPSTEISHESVVIHGITPSDVAEKPSIEKVICELTDFCGDDVIVGHFVSLDMTFINRDMKRICSDVLHNPAVDTRRLYEWIKENTDTFSRHYRGRADELDLFSLAREYGVPVSGAHNALGDAFITAQLFQRFLSMLPALGVSTVRDLLRIGKA